MNKQEYLTELEKALKSAGVRDGEDIIEEYSEHFDMKISDGYSEEEIAAKLAAPEELAGQYREITPDSPDEKSGKAGAIIARISKWTGVITLDVVMAPIFLALYAWMIAFAVAAISVAITGIVMIAGIDRIPALSPYVHVMPMPYICALVFGISLLALAKLTAFGTEYFRLYANQIFRKYTRWHKNVLGKGPTSPPLPLHPQISPKKRRIMRTIVLLSLVFFIVGLIVTLALMMILSRSLEPWHQWGWFV